MTAHYGIKVRDDFGTIVHYIDDFISLDITDIKNDAGSWTLKNHTIEQHPFEIGYGIIVYRNGAVYYSGIVEKVESSYNMETKTWEWTATGKGDISLLQWRVVFPTLRGQQSFLDRFKTFYAGASVISAITDLIYENLQGESNPRSLSYIGNSLADQDTDDVEFDANVQYRFDDLYKTILGLMGKANLAVRPEWNDSRSILQYHFYVAGKPLESQNIFYESKGHVTSIKRILQMPTVTTILASCDADDNSVWRYYGRSDIVSHYYPFKEKIIEVNLDELDGLQLDNIGLNTLAEAEAGKYPNETDGYEIEIKSESDAPQYQTDYKLGDTVGIVLANGTFFTAQVMKVRTSVSYGKESIVPYIGVSDNGVFNVVETNISGLNSSVTRILKRGQS